MTEIWFSSAGTRLFAVEHGAGTPVILLHGGLANHLVFQRITAAIAERYRLITPDLRGSGRSIDRGELSWDRLADDVVALIDHLGLTRAAIGGASFGAGCALRVALRHPARVSQLVLLSPAFAGADVGLTAPQRAAMDAMAAAGQRALAEGIAALFPLFDPLPPPIRAFAREVAATFDPGSVAASTRFMASGAQPFGTAAELAAIAMPTLVVPGTDPYHPAEIAELYRTHLPACTVRAATREQWADAIVEFLG